MWRSLNELAPQTTVPHRIVNSAQLFNMVLGALTQYTSWLRNMLTEKAKLALINVLAAGPIPRHVAFVMDGNRRYARRLHKQVQQGHAEGFVALRRVGNIFFYCP